MVPGIKRSANVGEPDDSGDRLQPSSGNPKFGLFDSVNDGTWTAKDIRKTTNGERSRRQASSQGQEKERKLRLLVSNSMTVKQYLDLQIHTEYRKRIEHHRYSRPICKMLFRPQHTH